MKGGSWGRTWDDFFLKIIFIDIQHKIKLELAIDLMSSYKNQVLPAEKKSVIEEHWNLL